MNKFKSSKFSIGRYTSGGSTTQDGRYLGWWERTVFTKATDDVTYVLTAKYDQRPDLLAKDQYGKETMMWLILQYNNIIDINTEFRTDMSIIMPAAAKAQYIQQASNTRSIGV